MANPLARALRKRMTPQETKLWLYLRGLKKSDGWKFRRQIPLRGFIVDFVCFEARLIIEADGGQHGEPAGLARDRLRDAALERGGFSIIRFWNVEIDREFDGVCRTVSDALLNAALRLAQSETPRRHPLSHRADAR